MFHLGSLSRKCKSVNWKQDEMITILAAASFLCLSDELAQHLSAYWFSYITFSSINPHA